MKELASNKKLKIAVLTGDGIGKEVTIAAMPVFADLRIPVELVSGEIGWECWREAGDPIPQRTWDLIENTDGVLLGAITSKPPRKAESELTDALRGRGLKYASPIIQLRQKLDLFANVRPVRGVGPKGIPFRFTVIRENTEGLYAGLDFHSSSAEACAHVNALKKLKGQSELAEEFSCALRVLTSSGLSRLFRFAFEHARAEGYKKVTLADKPNVLRESGQFAADVFDSIGGDYPEIARDVQNADAVGLGMVRRPEQYGVVVAENMFGDLLSDVAAGVMGGLGIAPSANVGNGKPYFEPVHGSAPKYAGQGKANPMAMFLSTSLLLRHFGFQDESERIESAVASVLSKGVVRTLDLGGSASTHEMALAIRAEIATGSPKPARTFRAALLATGEELVNGDALNTTSRDLSVRLHEAGWKVSEHRTTGDDESLIRRNIEELLHSNDLLVVTGGLGPTSDDRTRFALAAAADCPLRFDEPSWDRIVTRLSAFYIEIHESNRQQALFPEGCEIIENENGTAAGCALRLRQKTIVLLPGPPRECLPMFDKALKRLKLASDGNQAWYKWLLLGAIEGEVAARVDELAKGRPTGYRWSYPYLEVKIQGASPEQLVSIEQVLGSCRIGGDSARPASQQIKSWLKTGARLQVEDRATGGSLISTLMAPETRESLVPREGAVVMTVDGLGELWRGETSGTTLVRVGVRLPSAAEVQFRSFTLPLRGPEVRNAAVEFACDCLLKSGALALGGSTDVC